MANLLDIFSFESLDETPTYQSVGKDPAMIIDYPVVPEDDQEAVSIIQPDLKKGPWIAGGAPLRWYQGNTVSENDIDVFCFNTKQAEEVIQRIKHYKRFHIKHESENAVTIEYHKVDEWNKKWTIQIITRRYFSSLDEVLDNFDITVCQIGTCGNEWVMKPNTARDIRERNLRFTHPLHPDALKRLTKYWVYGYRPVPGTIESIQNNPDAVWKFSETGDYENAF
jgi:hypothetical protein